MRTGLSVEGKTRDYEELFVASETNRGARKGKSVTHEAIGQEDHKDRTLCHTKTIGKEDHEDQGARTGLSVVQEADLESITKRHDVHSLMGTRKTVE